MPPMKDEGESLLLKVELRCVLQFAGFGCNLEVWLTKWAGKFGNRKRSWHGMLLWLFKSKSQRLKFTEQLQETFRDGRTECWFRSLLLEFAPNRKSWILTEYLTFKSAFTFVWPLWAVRGVVLANCSLITHSTDIQRLYSCVQMTDVNPAFTFL